MQKIKSEYKTTFVNLHNKLSDRKTDIADYESFKKAIEFLEKRRN